MSKICTKVDAWIHDGHKNVKKCHLRRTYVQMQEDEPHTLQNFTQFLSQHRTSYAKWANRLRLRIEFKSERLQLNSTSRPQSKKCILLQDLNQKNVDFKQFNVQPQALVAKKYPRLGRRSADDHRVAWNHGLKLSQAKLHRIRHDPRTVAQVSQPRNTMNFHQR